MADWRRVEWTHEQLVAIRRMYDDAANDVVRNKNDDALPVLEILANEVQRWNLEFLRALRLCNRAANDSHLMTLT